MCGDALGRQVAGRNYPPTNKNTLIRALTEEWDKLPQQLLDNVVQKMNQACFQNVEEWSKTNITRSNSFQWNEKVSNHGSIPITIDCNVVAFIVFEEGFHQPIKRTKQSVFLDVTVFRRTLVD
ncbi:hypothetical protein TNCV_818721 [Trichonephila clavipes]|nr:hypothetical protein TNCV_818721 [Trichonephila clavipes]